MGTLLYNAVLRKCWLLNDYLSARHGTLPDKLFVRDVLGASKHHRLLSLVAYPK